MARLPFNVQHTNMDPDSHDSLPEWSKGVDSSSPSASCVGPNPTAVTFPNPRLRSNQETDHLRAEFSGRFFISSMGMTEPL